LVLAELHRYDAVLLAEITITINYNAKDNKPMNDVLSKKPVFYASVKTCLKECLKVVLKMGRNRQTTHQLFTQKNWCDT